MFYIFQQWNPFPNPTRHLIVSAPVKLIIFTLPETLKYALKSHPTQAPKTML